MSAEQINQQMLAALRAVRDQCLAGIDPNGLHQLQCGNDPACWVEMVNDAIETAEQGGVS